MLLISLSVGDCVLFNLKKPVSSAKKSNAPQSTTMSYHVRKCKICALQMDSIKELLYLRFHQCHRRISSMSSKAYVVSQGALCTILVALLFQTECLSALGLYVDIFNEQ